MAGGSSSSPCHLDRELADQISALLSPPSPESVKEHFDKLIDTRKCNGLRINSSNKNGKAVHATEDFDEGELVLKDPMLFASQHSSNKVDCLVCSYCFRFIGTIELQIGRRIYLQNFGLPTNKESDQSLSHLHKKICTRDLHNMEEESRESGSCHLGSNEFGNVKTSSPSEDVLQSLMNGDRYLPHTKEFPLPPVFVCPGGCKEEHYCSKLCADSDWETFHSQLCTGRDQEPSRRDAINNFIEHANGTNDIFILAAKGHIMDARASQMTWMGDIHHPLTQTFYVCVWVMAEISGFGGTLGLPLSLGYSSTLQLMKKLLWQNAGHPWVPVLVHGSLLSLLSCLNNASMTSSSFWGRLGAPSPNKTRMDKWVWSAWTFSVKLVLPSWSIIWRMMISHLTAVHPNAGSGPGLADSTRATPPNDIYAAVATYDKGALCCVRSCR